MTIENMFFVILINVSVILAILKMKKTIRKTQKPIEVTNDYLNIALVYGVLPFSVTTMVISSVLLVLPK